MAYCSDVSVQRVTADRCGVFGTYFAYVDGAEMVDTSAANTNHALDFRACKNLLLKGCRAIDCDQGIFFSYVDDSRIQNCEATAPARGSSLPRVTTTRFPSAGLITVKTA